MWILTICLGLSTWGCGAWQSAEFDSSRACYSALENMKITDTKTVAYCAPKK